MTLLELMKFLQKMAEANLEHHLKEPSSIENLREMSYHQGQLSILDALIPRIPPGVEALEEEDVA